MLAGTPRISGGGNGSLTPGTTPIVGGTNKGILYNNAGFLGVAVSALYDNGTGNILVNNIYNNGNQSTDLRIQENTYNQSLFLNGDTGSMELNGNDLNLNASNAISLYPSTGVGINIVGQSGTALTVLAQDAFSAGSPGDNGIIVSAGDGSFDFDNGYSGGFNTIQGGDGGGGVASNDDDVGGAGGFIFLLAGFGGGMSGDEGAFSVTGGGGGQVQITAGGGGDAADGSNTIGGLGGLVSITAGNGGAGDDVIGDGGNVQINAGSGGNNGKVIIQGTGVGNILLSSSGNSSKVGINRVSPSNKFEVNGSVGFSVTASSTNASLDQDVLYVYTGSGGHTFTLPAISTTFSRFFWVKNRGSGNVTVSRSGSDQIYDSSAVNTKVVTPGQAFSFQNDASFWNLM